MNIVRKLIVGFVALFLAMGFVNAQTQQAHAEANAPQASPIEVLSESPYYVLKVDLRDSRVRVRTLLANNDGGGMQTMDGIKNRVVGMGYPEWAVINGDYFGGGCPGGTNCAQGLTYIDGAKRDNWSAYGTTWPVRGNIGFDSGNNVDGAIGDAQGKRHNVIAGGPVIIRDGGSPECRIDAFANNVAYMSTGEQFNAAGGRTEIQAYCTGTRPFSMIGFSADRRYLFVGVSHGGVTMLQAAQWLKDRGAHFVMKLDGGGSTGFYHNGQQIHATDGRALANAFAVFVSNAPAPTQLPPSTGNAYQLFGMGDYNGDRYESSQTVANLGSIGWDNRVESMKVLAGYTVMSCTEPDFGGDCAETTGPREMSDVNQLREGMRRNMSSIKVCSGPCNPAPPPTPTPVPVQRPDVPALAGPDNNSKQSHNSDIWLGTSGAVRASEYLFEYWREGGAAQQPCGWLASGWCHVGVLENGRAYFYRAKARNSGGESDWSETRTFLSCPNSP